VVADTANYPFTKRFMAYILFIPYMAMHSIYISVKAKEQTSVLKNGNPNLF